MLVERRDRDVGAVPHAAAVGRERAEQEIDQRGLAAAVRADEADAVAALDAGREVAHDGAAVVGLVDLVGLDHQRAGRVRRGGAERSLPGHAAIGAALLPQRVQMAEPAHVALAPRGDAVAQPVLLVDDLAVELVLVALLLGEQFVAPGLEAGKAALDAARLAAIEPDGGARQVGEKAPVVADDDQRAAAAGELAAPAIRWSADRDGWSARRAAECRARAPARARARRAAPRRRRGGRDPRCRRGRAAPADSAPRTDRRRARGRLPHRRAWSRSRRNPAPAAGSGPSRRAARSACRGRARSARRRS